MRTTIVASFLLSVLLMPRMAAADWGPVGSGTSGQVLGLAIYQDDLLAGGIFTLAGGDSANRVARWNRVSWGPVGPGVSGENPPPHPPPTVFALSIYDGQLIAAGLFSQAGDSPANNIASWDGTTWSPLGLGTSGMTVSATVFNGALIVGGPFSNAGGGVANHIAQWNGSSWSPLGSGTSGTVRSMVVFEGELVVAGSFSQAGGQPANNIARWDGTSWISMPGTNGSINAVAVYDGQLIAGGWFTQAGGNPVNYIARWDGTTWEPLGLGMGGGYYIPDVTCLSSFDSSLIVGGDFTQAGGHSANYIARWDGTSWSSMGSGLGDPSSVTVNAMMTYNGSLIVGGYFAQAGGNPADNISRWDEPGSGVSEPGWISAIRPIIQPNPFRARTSIVYSLPLFGYVHLTVHDMLGRNVATLVNQVLTSGNYSVSWDGRNDDGGELPAGVYVTRIETSAGTTTGKVVLTRGGR